MGAPSDGWLLVVHHSRTGSTARLTDAAVEAARAASESGTEVRARSAFDAGAEDVLGARAVLLGTPARFGYMSGALKDFFERVYHPCLERTRGLAYGLVVKGDTDVDGAVASVERIVAGLQWRLALPPVRVVGEIRPADVEAAAEVGAALMAGLEAGIF
ncbi:MAG: hypothetical protein ACYDA2_02480 [Acidimicrobiales bacterium]